MEGISASKYVFFNLKNYDARSALVESTKKRRGYLSHMEFSIYLTLISLCSFKMPSRDQIKMFALNATTLMAVHGNAIGHAFWMPPGSNVWEFHSYGDGSAWYEHLFNDAKREFYKNSYSPSATPLHGFFIDYKVIRCRDLSCKDPSAQGFNANVIAQVDKLQILLDNFNPQY
jgi:hypothetical protein